MFGDNVNILAALIMIASSIIVVPIDHDYECMDHEYCGDYDYEEDDGDGESYCFLGCDNIIIIPGLPGME